MDIYSALLPIFYISLFLGLTPLKLVGDVGARKFSFSKLAAAYSWLVFITNLACFYLTLTIESKSETGSANIGLLTMANQLQMGADVLLTLFVIIMGFINSARLINCFTKLGEVDESLKALDIPLPYTRSLVVVVFEFVLITLMFATVNFCRVYFHSFDVLSDANLPKWIAYHIPKVATQISLLHFINAALLLRHRFKILNNRLLEFVDPLHLVNTISQSSGFLSKKQVHAFKAINKPSITTIKELRSLHDVLCGLTKQLNFIYSPQTLFTIATAFINVTNGFNNCFNVFLSLTTTDNDQVYGRLIVGFLLVAGFIVNLVALCATCAAASDEANYTAVLVHKLLLKIKDVNLTDELQLFSMQLLHHKVQFTACGFFPLDATLLYSIVGGVTTYLVILIQFQLSSQQNRSPAANGTLANLTSKN